jgi:hypothetical protein
MVHAGRLSHASSPLHPNSRLAENNEMKWEGRGCWTCSRGTAPSRSLPPFDVVLCLGGLYHIADPAFVLRQIGGLSRERLILQSDQVLSLPGNWAKFRVWRQDKSRLSPRAAAAWRIPHSGRAPARLVEVAAVSVVSGELRADVKLAAGHAALDSIAATELRPARYCA